MIITVTQYQNGSPSTAQSDTQQLRLSKSSSSAMASFYWCVADVAVTRQYSYVGGSTCCVVGPERVTGRNAITIPAPTMGGTDTTCSMSCVAPAL